MIRRWPALTYYLYALQLAALSHFYFNPLYFIHNKKCRLLSNKTKSSLHLILNGVVIVYAKSANSAVER